jgi:hypothetical protein
MVTASRLRGDTAQTGTERERVIDTPLLAGFAVSTDRDREREREPSRHYNWLALLSAGEGQQS